MVGKLRAQFFTLLEVWGGCALRCWPAALDTKTSPYDGGPGLQVPMVLEHDYIPHTYICFLYVA
jgi:hypothetical protein